jgi:glutathione S-transferase
MDLFFSPLACSMASRITAYEIGADVNFIRVDTRAGKLADGSDYAAINGMGQVPALRTDTGDIFTENSVVLQVIADSKPDAGLIPPAGDPDRYRVQQWLSFVSSELHKAVFSILLSPKSSDEAKAYARGLLAPRLTHLEQTLADRDFLATGRFTIADAYLTTVLNWARFTGVDLKPYPCVEAYFARMFARPSATRAAGEEMTLFQAA